MEAVQQWLEAASAAAPGWSAEEWILAVGVALLVVALGLWLQVQRQFRIERGIWRLLLDLQYDIRRLRDELSEADIRALRGEADRREPAAAGPPPEAGAAPDAEPADESAGEGRPEERAPPEGDAIGTALANLERVEARLRRPAADPSSRS